MEPLQLPSRDTPNGIDEVGPIQVGKPVIGLIPIGTLPELLIRRVGVSVVPRDLGEG